MPKIAELKEINGQIWARLEMNTDEGEVTLWTKDEIKDYRLASVRDFLVDLYQDFKDKL